MLQKIAMRLNSNNFPYKITQPKKESKKFIDVLFIQGHFVAWIQQQKSSKSGVKN